MQQSIDKTSYRTFAGTDSGVILFINYLWEVAGAAAALVRFEAVQDAAAAIAVPPRIVLHGSVHFVRLLQVLVCPHVGRQRGRQRVERDRLHLVRKRHVAQYAEYRAVAEHRFHHRAQLRTTARIQPRQALVAREHAAGLAVVSVHLVHAQVGGVDVRLVVAGTVLDGGRLQRLAVVHAVVLHVPLTPSTTTGHDSTTNDVSECVRWRSNHCSVACCTAGGGLCCLC